MTATIKPLSTTVRNARLLVYPPRDANEAQTRGVFVSDSGITYAHFNGNLEPATMLEKGTNGLVVCYGELADKLGELMIEHLGSLKRRDPRQMEIQADINMDVAPTTVNGVSGNNVTFKVYGFAFGNFYYTTKGQQLVVSVRRDTQQREASERKAKLSFF